jgi:hypothetical protein
MNFAIDLVAGRRRAMRFAGGERDERGGVGEA